MAVTSLFPKSGAGALSWVAASSGFNQTQGSGKSGCFGFNPILLVLESSRVLLEAAITLDWAHDRT